MQPGGVVIGFDVFKDFPSSQVLGFKDFSLRKRFGFEAAKERLASRVVVAISLAAHTLLSPDHSQEFLDQMTGILAASVGMENQSGLRTTAGEGSF